MPHLLVALPLWFMSLGCAEQPDVALELSPLMPTVVEVSWPRLTQGKAWVEYGEGYERVAREAPGSSDEEVRVLLVGARPGEALRLRAVERQGLRRLVGPELRVEVGLLLGAPPPLLVDTWAPELDVSGLLLTTAIGDHHGPMLIDRGGQVVWFWPLDPGRMVIDAEVDQGGGGVWLLTMPWDAMPWDAMAPPAGRLLRVGWDGALEVDLEVFGAHHALAQLGDGRVAVVRDSFEVDAQGVEHVNVQALALGEDGQQEVLADLWSLSPTYASVSGDRGPHSNGLHYSAERDTLLWSFLALHAVAEVEVSSGEVSWAVGQLDGALSWPSPVPSVFHAPSYTQDGDLMIFDNGDEAHGARVSVYEVDARRGQVELLRSYPWSGEGSVQALGDARELEDGHVLVSWGLRGQLEELSGVGERLWRASSGVGTTLGNVERVSMFEL